MRQDYNTISINLNVRRLILMLSILSLVTPLALLDTPLAESDEAVSEAVTSQASNQVSASSSGTYADFNGDGFDDLAIGVPNEDLSTDGSLSFAGAVNVLYGSAAGLQATGTGGPNDQFWHQNSSCVNDAAEELDRFGSSLAAGDFNDDGFDDLAIGVPFEGIGTLDHPGAVNVLYGSSTGLQCSGTGGPADQFWNQNSSGVLDAAEDSDSFGFALAA